jgi:hypothetical protein
MRLEDAGRKSGQRHIRFAVDAPGAMAPGLARFKYEEWYERDRAGWRLSRYHYDYWNRLHGGRLGYHWHRLDRRDATDHAHCEPPDSESAPGHFRFYEMDLFEAHEEFIRLYASEEPIDCASLRPLVLKGRRR